MEVLSIFSVVGILDRRRLCCLQCRGSLYEVPTRPRGVELMFATDLANLYLGPSQATRSVRG
jgi:hypothetical protein